MGKNNLKATFSNYQEKQRQVQLHKAREAAKKDGVKKGKTKLSAKAKGKRPRLNMTIPFSASDTILLIGEGNFSFTRALFTAVENLPATNVTATTYDSEEDCYVKYPDAASIIEDLRSKGVKVLFGVDVRRLGAIKELKNTKWQRVVWNFPHAGKSISDQDRNVLENQLLILDFLKSVAPLLEEGAPPALSLHPGKKRVWTEDESDEQSEAGEHNEIASSRCDPGTKQRGTVLITLRNTQPYTLWDLPRLAKRPPTPHPSSCSPSVPNQRYVQFRSFAFLRYKWKGYEHRMTKGWVEGLGTGADRAKDDKGYTEDRTWEFYLAD